MELGRKEATFFGMPELPLVQVPHHPSGAARPGEHREDAEVAIGPVRQLLTDAGEQAGVGASEAEARAAE